MSGIRRLLRTLTWHPARDERGQTMVEYGLMISLIATSVVVMLGVTGFGAGIRDFFTNTAASLP